MTWSYGKKYGITLNQLVAWWSENPAKLAGQKDKVPKKEMLIIYFITIKISSVALICVGSYSAGIPC